MNFFAYFDPKFIEFFAAAQVQNVQYLRNFNFHRCHNYQLKKN